MISASLLQHPRIEVWLPQNSHTHGVLKGFGYGNLSEKEATQGHEVTWLSKPEGLTNLSQGQGFQERILLVFRFTSSPSL